jgi:hypothetical protein
MPESMKDRCTKSHEYIFLLSKSKNYYFDVESIKEPTVDGRELKRKRSVWEVPTKPYKGAHFAVYPPELIEPCIQGETVRVANPGVFAEMHKHQFGIDTQVVVREQGNYDTWVKNDGIKYRSEDLTQIHWIGEAYTFMPFTQRLSLHEEYRELVLVNR